MNECSESMYARNNAFYMILTPSISKTIPKTSEEKAHREGLMSDFTVTLKSMMLLNPRKKWVMSLMEAVLPLDDRILRNGQIPNEHWFTYSYGYTSTRTFKEKHYFHSRGGTTVLESFSRALNGLEIGNPLSLTRITSVIEVGVVDSNITTEDRYVGNTFIRLKEELPAKCGVFLKMPLSLYDSLFGKTLRFRTYYNLKLLGEGDCRWSRSSNMTSGRIMPNSGLKKDTTFIAVEKGSFHTNVGRGRLIDVECDLLESNYVGGIPGKILKTLHDGTSSENMSEIYRESKHPTAVPLAITEFNTIRIRLLDHSTGEPVKYDYSSTTGRPYMSVALQPT